MNRYTTSYKLAGTDTFRLSACKLFGFGGNAQNIPDRIRRIFVPDEGKIFVQVDQSGAEALIVAYLCRYGNFRQLFEAGIKSHVYVALNLFASYWESEMKKEDINFSIHQYVTAPIKMLKSLPHWKSLESKIKKHDTYYAIGKMVCHASNYGMQAPTFTLNVLQRSEGKIVLSIDQGKYFLSTYHKLFPEIGEWHEETKQKLYRTRTLHNLFHYPRYFTQPFDARMFMAANAFVPQSTVGCITNIAYTQLQEWIENNQPEAEEYDLLGNCHDSYLLQLPQGEEKFGGDLMQSFMNQKLTAPRGEVFFMKSEAMAGMNWGKHDKQYNPEGLKEI